MNEKLNKLKELLEIKTDIELGEYLGKSRKTIWEYRKKNIEQREVTLILDLLIGNTILKRKLAEIQKLSKEIS